MKTEIIKGGINFLKADYDELAKNKGTINGFFEKYIIKFPGINKQICLTLENLNRADGGGPIVSLINLNANLKSDSITGKIDISYQLKLEWGCEAIKKDVPKSEKFDVEFDLSNNVFFLYLFIV